MKCPVCGGKNEQCHICHGAELIVSGQDDVGYGHMFMHCPMCHTLLCTINGKMYQCPDCMQYTDTRKGP